MLEGCQLAVGLGGQVLRPGEAGETALHDVFHEVLALGRQGEQLGFHLGGQLAVDDLGDDEEWEQLEVVGGIEKAPGEITRVPELLEEGLGAAADERDVRGGGAAVEGLLHDRTDPSPLVLADETHALAEELAEKVARVVVFGLEMLVRVFEDGLDVFGAGEDTVCAVSRALQKRERGRHVHFGIHARPKTVDGAQLLFPALRVGLALEEFGAVALTVRPLVGQSGKRGFVVDMLGRIAKRQVELEG